MTRNIGLEVKTPAGVCSDSKCPFHGTLPVRGRVFEGIVISDKSKATAIVQWERFRFVPKYERYERRKTRIVAHSPECISAKKGDLVKIAECRPLSKTKSFVVVEKLKELILEEKERFAKVAEKKGKGVWSK